MDSHEAFRDELSSPLGGQSSPMPSAPLEFTAATCPGLDPDLSDTSDDHMMPSPSKDLLPRGMANNLISPSPPLTDSRLEQRWYASHLFTAIMASVATAVFLSIIYVLVLEPSDSSIEKQQPFVTFTPSRAPISEPTGNVFEQELISRLTTQPTTHPKEIPTIYPTISLGTAYPTHKPSHHPTTSRIQTMEPSVDPSGVPSMDPTAQASVHPTPKATSWPTVYPTKSALPTLTSTPTNQPIVSPTYAPSLGATNPPPTFLPTTNTAPTQRPTTRLPTLSPTTPSLDTCNFCGTNGSCGRSQPLGTFYSITVSGLSGSAWFATCRAPGFNPSDCLYAPNNQNPIVVDATDSLIEAYVTCPDICCNYIFPRSLEESSPDWSTNSACTLSQCRMIQRFCFGESTTFTCPVGSIMTISKDK